MGLESSTYINGLTQAWPIAGDPKSQGDDHIRLVKTVLQNTFPNATGPFYLPKALTLAGGALYTLTAADQNATIYCDTGAGNVTLTFPVTFVAGWSCEVLKYSGDQNGVMCAATSGNIFSQPGAVASVRVGATCSMARFTWSGGTWFCTKNGPLIGSTVNFDGATVPAGYLALDGSAFNGTAFAELAAMIGTTTLRDKRGRVEAGVDGAGRLANVFVGSLGNAGGLDNHSLTIGQIPFHNHGGTSDNDSPDHSHSYNQATSGFQKPTGTGTTPFEAYTGASTGGASTRHTHTFTTSTNPSGLGSVGWHPNVQPTIITQKLIRAC
jgi:microcystin-dependent protein